MWKYATQCKAPRELTGPEKTLAALEKKEKQQSRSAATPQTLAARRRVPLRNKTLQIDRSAGSVVSELSDDFSTDIEGNRKPRRCRKSSFVLAEGPDLERLISFATTSSDRWLRCGNLPRTDEEDIVKVRVRTDPPLMSGQPAISNQSPKLESGPLLGMGEQVRSFFSAVSLIAGDFSPSVQVTRPGGTPALCPSSPSSSGSDTNAEEARSMERDHDTVEKIETIYNRDSADYSRAYHPATETDSVFSDCIADVEIRVQRDLSTIASSACAGPVDECGDNEGIEVDNEICVDEKSSASGIHEQ
jgi:hypothetical protein